MMIRKINRGTQSVTPTTSGISNSSRSALDDAVMKLKVPTWDILEATLFVLDAALTASTLATIALLGKWCWRMLVDREGLWFRVLAARYGIERGRLRDGGRSGSSWWREIVRIRDGVEGIGGGWFRDRVRKKTKSCMVGEMASLGWGAGGEAWVWRRQLWVWEEEMLGEFILSDAEGLIWHNQVPLKVSIFAWRLLRDRLPTKANLVTRGILSSEAYYCVSGCGAVKSAHHLFISCSTFGSLWSLVNSWIGSPLVDSHNLSDHFIQFTSSAGGFRARRSFMQLI
ncbi:hypothetical protein TSUD_275140 [Trifolium subterraneum]|uniref:Reverse transcriptase zinc-binding domain-containing protein n=1 Tax=Trifolium subterraneum TaxID=3900 RepID=A0A2Z6NJP7_TRISU|nr:hypothetical protein TSUD_275140 [Trifolium subterraneum]